jgi:glycosyltransferase involved in cell wall biosynthesis
MLVLVSFEGPDRYSQAGGLGVRVSGLADALADLGYETHLFFVGDPDAPGEERAHDGHLILHRWAQWISANCPDGVYDGEAAKVADLTASLPAYLVENVLASAIAAGRTPLIIFEEWQTAECACRVSDLLTTLGIRARAVISWNANNCYGFERIDWPRLAAATTITTISRYMRSIIRSYGADARVIPNGIPASALHPASADDLARIRAAATSRQDVGFLFKMARWEREKGWTQALDAVRQSRSPETAPSPAGVRRPILIARSGGPSGVGNGLLHDAQSRGLRVVVFDSEREFANGLAESVRASADVISLRFGVSAALGRALYAAVDGVLANSVSEPFGLVGLETMAAGGVPFTGGTGEDYAIQGRNAIVLETLDPGEIVARWNELSSSPRLGARIRRAARKTARTYTWPAVVELLVASLTHQARRQLSPLPAPVLEPHDESPSVRGAHQAVSRTPSRNEIWFTTMSPTNVTAQMSAMSGQDKRTIG